MRIVGNLFSMAGFIFFLLLACTTKEGVEVENLKGRLFILSTNVDSARIFLDYHDTGHLTPALLTEIPTGQHVIHLFSSGYCPHPDSMLVIVEENQTDTLLFEMSAVPYGDLTINSTPDSARVFLNRLEFGLTPLQIHGLPVGEYTILLLKSNFEAISDTITILENDHLQLVYQLQEDLRRFVLLEHFSNTSCPPCPTSDAIIDNLADSYGPQMVVVIGYHANYPSPSDPMYLAARAANDSRLQFYQPPSLPRAYVDGQLVTDPLSETCYRNLIDPQLQQDTLLTLAFQQVNRSDTLLQGKLEIKALADLNSDHRLFLALIEDEIDYPNPPGTNGQSHFEAVLRSFYPDGNGIVLNLAASSKIKIDFAFKRKIEWGDDLTVVAFVQNSVTKAVVQSGWTRYPRF